jgi:endonuclease/exonuclease/phosphatase family metal-dependent hydrolase
MNRWRVVAAFGAVAALSTVTVAASLGTHDEPAAERGAPTSTPSQPSPGVQTVVAGHRYGLDCRVAPRLTVLTFNIHYGMRHGSFELSQLADEIDASGAGVVALQEVERNNGPRTDGVDPTRWLAQRLGMHAVFGANRSRRPLLAGGPPREYGTALLSRYPIRSWRNLSLPNRPGLEARGLLLATLDVNGIQVTVGNTHLQHTSQRVRVAQMRAVVSTMAELRSPRLLLGDLNDESGTPPVALTRRIFTDPWPSVGVGDGRTVPRIHPRRRIDYTLADPGLTARRSVVLTSEVSDHRSVRTTFRVCGS